MILAALSVGSVLMGSVLQFLMKWRRERHSDAAKELAEFASKLKGKHAKERLLFFGEVTTPSPPRHEQAPTSHIQCPCMYV